jgi:hypothetical protein
MGVEVAVLQNRGHQGTGSRQLTFLAVETVDLLQGAEQELPCMLSEIEASVSRP